jgi:hypothetical protein
MARPIYKQSMPVRTAFYMLLAAFFMVFSPASRAETNPAYTVEGVEVDVVAENAVKAREKAVDEAQVKAYQMLAERFLGEEAMKTFKTPDPITVSSLVQDFEVTKEQLSKKRYKGTYTVRFRPNTFKGSMAAKGISYSDAPKKPVLVLPFYQTGGDTVLWSDANPWMNAWRSFSSTTNVIVPIGDANDIAQVNDSDALQYDPLQVQELAARYGADDVAIVLASPEPTGTQGRIVVNVYNNGFEGPTFVRKLEIDQQAGEQEATMFQRAAGQVRAFLGENWKSNAAYNPSIATPAPQTTTTVTTTTYGQPQIPVTQAPQTAAPVPYTRTALGTPKTYIARARFNSVQDWVRMKNTLDRVYGMQSVMIKSLKSREAALDMRYAGDISALQLSLQNAGLTMRGAQDGVLEIYSGAGATPVYR